MGQGRSHFTLFVGYKENWVQLSFKVVGSLDGAYAQLHCRPSHCITSNEVWIRFAGECSLSAFRPLEFTRGKGANTANSIPKSTHHAAVTGTAPQLNAVAYKTYSIQSTRTEAVSPGTMEAWREPASWYDVFITRERFRWMAAYRRGRGVVGFWRWRRLPVPNILSLFFFFSFENFNANAARKSVQTLGEEATANMWSAPPPPPITSEYMPMARCNARVFHPRREYMGVKWGLVQALHCIFPAGCRRTFCVLFRFVFLVGLWSTMNSLTPGLVLYK